MKLKSLVLMSVAAVVATGVFAGEYAWNGGASGAWNTPTNWTPNGTPGAGDTATFNVTAEITDNFTVGEGTLRIENASGTTLSLRGSVSGKGGIFKTGAGALQLYADNPFEGPFTTQGMKPGTDVDSSAVYVHASGALGRGQVSIDPDGGNNGSGGRIYFDPGADKTVTLVNPINQGGANSPKRAKLYFITGHTVLNGDITCIYRLYFEGSANCQSVRFGGTVTGSNQYLHLAKFGTNTHIYFENAVAVGTLYAYDCKATLHFSGPGSESAYAMELYTPVVCEAKDAISTTYKRFMFSKNGVFDLNGYDQTFVQMWGAGGAMNTFPESAADLATTAVTSPVDKPAKMIFKSACFPNAFRCPLTGAVGVQWQIGGTLTFSNSVSTTCGEMIVSSGAICVADGAAFTALSDISIANMAKFEIKETAASDCFTRELHLVTGATLAISNGMKLVTNHLYVNGEEVEGYTTYQAGGAITQLVGEGALEVVREANEYVGEDGGDWSEPSNWSMGEVPGEDSNVKVIARSVTLSATTPVLHDVTIGTGAQLLFADMSASLKAESVTVAAGGLVTSSGPFTDEANAARVSIDCATLTVAEGGAIDVSSKGWSGCTNVSQKNGYGPGAGSDRQGASHGGFGGRSYLDQNIRLDYSRKYGSADEPVTHGSGGSRQDANGNPVHGGGVVRLVVSGELMVDGEIRADGGDVRDVPASGVGYKDTAGAGGSVWITCGTIAGSGLVSAAGGKGGAAFNSHPMYIANNGTEHSRAGGGGRVAVDYDPVLQAAKTPGVRISASEGRYKGYASRTWTLATDDEFFTDAEPGTLKFTDDVLFNQLLGKGLSGKVVGKHVVTVDGDLDYTWGHLRFDGEGVEFSVSGDMTISGAESRLEIGQCVVTNLTPYNCKWTGPTLNKLTVGGALTVTDGAALDLRAAEKGALTDFGAVAKVGGKMTVGSGAFVYAWCDPLKPIPVKFEVGSLDVQLGGTLSANERGAAGAWGGTGYKTACGNRENFTGVGTGGARSGCGKNGGGGSHGGLGGLPFFANETSGATRQGATVASGAEEDPYLPIHPGAGGSCDGYGHADPASGGVIYVLADGDINVDGTVCADASLYTTFFGIENMHYIGYSAGGSIYLFGDTFTSGASARISARGASAVSMGNKGFATEAKPARTTIGGAGGGGCIAVWTGRGNLEDGTYRPRKLKRLAETTTPESLGYGGTFDVSGGQNAVTKISWWQPFDEYKDTPTTFGSAGTIRFAHLDPRQGVMLIVR